MLVSRCKLQVVFQNLLTPNVVVLKYSSMSVVAPTALRALSAATCMNIWYLRFWRRLSMVRRAPSREWWLTRRFMWLVEEGGREGGRVRL